LSDSTNYARANLMLKLVFRHYNRVKYCNPVRKAQETVKLAKSRRAVDFKEG